MASVADPQAVRDYFLYAAAVGCGEPFYIALEMADQVAPVKYRDPFAPNPRVEAVLTDLREREAWVAQVYHGWGVSPRIAQLYAGLNTRPEVNDI